MKTTFVIFTIMTSGTCVLAQVDTFHVFKDGAVNIVQPKTFTNVAFLEVPNVQSYMVIGKTEIQNNGTSGQVTCELVAVEGNARETVIAGDPLTVSVPQGQFAGVAVTLVTGPHPCDPDTPCSKVRYRLRCTSLGATSPTSFVARQTKITAHQVSGLQVTSQ